MQGDPNQFRLLVIDSKPLTRGCLVAAMQGSPGLGTITAAQDADEARQFVSNGLDFNAIVLSLDQDVTDESGLSAAIVPVQAVLPNTPMLLIASTMTPANLNMALHLGVRGYLTMDTALAVTLDAIRFVCGGWMVYPAFKQDRRPYPTMKPLPSTPDIGSKLTPRQEQVLQCLATGMPNKSIAYELNMSESTVKAHIKEIMQRVGAANRTQVVALLGQGNGQSMVVEREADPLEES